MNIRKKLSQDLIPGIVSNNTKHGHDVWENCPWTVVFVGIKENPQTLEFVSRPKDRAG